LRRVDIRLQNRHLRDERQERRLERAHALELVLRVDHLLAEAVDRHLERLELRPPRQLLLQLLVDVGAEAVEAVEPLLELVDEGHARGDARDLRVELRDRFVQPRRLFGPLLDERQLAENRVHLRLELGRLRRHRRQPLAEPLEPHAIGGELLADLRRLGVRGVEVLDVLAQQVEILPALAQRVHLPRCLLREVVDLAETVVQRVERQLLLRQLLALREQRLEALGEAVDLLRELDEALVLRGEPVHARLGVAHAALQRPHPLVERLELLLLEAERVYVRADRLEEDVGVLLQLRRLVVGFLPHPRRRLELRVGLGRELFGARQRVVGARHLLHAFVQLRDLDVHRPDHLVDAIRLHDRVLDGLLLAVERLRLVRDVLGERVERREPLLGVLAQLVQPRERTELRLDFLHRRHRGGRVFTRLARDLADLRVILGERRRALADVIELALERARLREGLLHLAVGLLQLAAELVERRSLLLLRFERRLRAERLRREVLHRLAVLLQLAVRPERLLRRLLRLPGRLLQPFDAPIDLLELAGPLVERREPLRDLVEHRGDAARLLGHLLERLPERRELRAAGGQRGQHGADGAALLARGRNQPFQLVALLLYELALAAGHVLEGV